MKVILYLNTTKGTWTTPLNGEKPMSHEELIQVLGRIYDENGPHPKELTTQPVYLYTLDSHDYFGPFINEAIAHDWAKRTERSTYQLLKDTLPPSDAVVYIPRVSP